LSDQQSAISDQLFDITTEHELDLLDLVSDLVIVFQTEHIQVMREHELVLQLAGGSESDTTEADKITTPSTHSPRQYSSEWMKLIAESGWSAQTLLREETRR
jgi:hypothetical protein